MIYQIADQSFHQWKLNHFQSKCLDSSTLKVHHPCSIWIRMRPKNRVFNYYVPLVLLRLPVQFGKYPVFQIPLSHERVKFSEVGLINSKPILHWKDAIEEWCLSPKDSCSGSVNTTKPFSISKFGHSSKKSSRSVAQVYSPSMRGIAQTLCGLWDAAA